MCYTDDEAQEEVKQTNKQKRFLSEWCLLKQTAFEKLPNGTKLRKEKLMERKPEEQVRGESTASKQQDPPWYESNTSYWPFISARFNSLKSLKREMGGVTVGWRQKLSIECKSGK